MIKLTRDKKKFKNLKVTLCVTAIIMTLIPVPNITSAKTSEKSQMVVSLGDSYSSGEGIEPFYGQNEEASVKVNNPDWLAHRSEKSWPGRLKLPGVKGKMAENRDEHWFFAAASGAETRQIQGSQDKEYKKGKYSGEAHLKSQLKIFDELENEKADYVTLTLGGNDAGFSDIVTEAVSGSTYLNHSNLSDKLNSIWDKFRVDGGIRDSLLQAYTDIADRAGTETIIIVAGYPTLLEQKGKGAFFSREEAEIINDAVRNFNTEIENIVNECKNFGTKICFASVEDAFSGHEAYSDQPYINKVMIGAKKEDLKDSMLASSYSMHPNEKGAAAYAQCVQKKIDALEKDEGQAEFGLRTASKERDIVLALDVSGSMSGTPLEETKKASKKFINTVLEEEAGIGTVTYDDNAVMLSDFNMNNDFLTKVIEKADGGGGTNIEAGLSKSYDMLKKSKAKKRIIVLMSDGEPNQGKVGEELISYSNKIKKEGVYIYTLGFFKNIGDKKSSAQELMEKIASEGCHYEVANAEDLVFFFGDIADQLNGQKYIYVRIACPVDVSVSHNGEELSSMKNEQSTRTDFGTLTFEENKENPEDRIKILRLKEGTDYGIRIEGTGTGEMNYTIGFMDENGKYSDRRKFPDIAINKSTRIDTVARNANSTTLNVDEDGDGKYDMKLRAKKNAVGKIVDYTHLYYVAAGIIVLILLIVVLLISIFKSKKV